MSTTSNPILNKKLSVLHESAADIQTLVHLLSQAKANDFISGPEAAGIFKAILKEAGLKETTKKPEVKVKEEN